MPDGRIAEDEDEGGMVPLEWVDGTDFDHSSSYVGVGFGFDLDLRHESRRCGRELDAG